MDIKTVISERGLSQVELAKRMLDTDSEGLKKMTAEEQQKKLKSTVSYVSQLISGKSDPSMKKLDMLAQVIGCQRWEFFRDEIEAAGIQLVEAAQQPEGVGERTSEQSEVNEKPADDVQKEQKNDDLPFKDEEPKQESMPGVVICPHCKGRFVAEISFKAIE